MPYGSFDLTGYLNYGRHGRRRLAPAQGFTAQVVTPPASSPVAVADAQAYARTDSDDAIFTRLIEAVTLETERSVLWRGIVSQRRRVYLDSPLSRYIHLEPTNSIVSFTRWTEADPSVVIPASAYSVTSSDPAGTVISLDRDATWDYPERTEAGYTVTYDCGWAADQVPEAIKHMILISVAAQYQNIDPFAAAGVRDLKVGSVALKAAMPPNVMKLGMAYAYRQTIGRG